MNVLLLLVPHPYTQTIALKVAIFLFLNQMKPLAVILPSFWPTCLHLFLLCTLNFLWFQPSNASSAIGNETDDDHLALLKFKESVSYDPHSILASWNSSTHFCNWHGITCSRRHQRVTTLMLNGYNLRGLLSPHIGNLSFLRSVILQDNNFYGKIPQELGRLFRLQVLSLSYNTLTGEIPINLTSCSELRILDVGRNHLSGRIPMEIGSLRKLEELYLIENNLSGEIPGSMWNLSSFGVINLKRNHLEGNIPEEIGHLKNLTALLVSSNNFSGTLPSSLYNLSSLIKIVIPFNQFTGSLPANMFSTLPNLQLFEIGSNQISGTIPPSVTNASVLQKLDITSNHFVGHVPSLAKLQNLSVMNLHTNSLGRNSPKDWEFLKSLINCSKLNTLDLSINNFGGPLPNSIGNLSTQLIYLYLGGNKISGKIPAALGNLINLIVLGVDYNFFIETIPTTFGRFQKMQELYMGGNKLSGELPPFIGNLSKLFLLELSQNMLEGHIPPSIGNCQSLNYLDLSQNNLTGNVAEVIGLSSLSILLNLSDNSFNGTLPLEVGKLQNINKFDVSENHLSGQIPETIGDCLSLEYLYLQGNSFQETIPSSLALLKGLRHLDLSRNNLFGSIPKGLQDISVLEYLNVSFNMLDGEVPNKGVFGNASAISIVGNRKLCGGISDLRLPPCPTKVMKQSKHRNFKLIMVIIFVVAFLLLLLSIFGIYYRRKSKNKSSWNSPTIDQISRVSYKSLHNATDGFSVRNLIGSGSFGDVYRGNLESERVVAIKVLNLQKKGAYKSFMAECNAIRNIRHRNLVKVLTCCSSTDYQGHKFKALVYEYMANGSLEKWLHPGTEHENHPQNFLLKQRLDIVIDVAFALHYLHCECEQPIVHCDLKPSNVLLDGDMVAHVSDFGLARLISTIRGTSNKQSSTIGIVGTIGYTPPEYGMGSEVSTQGDMYSFGILIMEMFTGRRPTNNIFENGQNLHNYVKIALPNNLLQIVDPNLFPRDAEVTTNEEANNEILTLVHPNMEKCLVSIFRIGLACSVESPTGRMNITDVTRELHHIKDALHAGGIKHKVLRF